MKKLTAIGLAIRVASLGALAVLCSGCPDPNIYATPRTTPVGKVSHLLALQAARYRFDNTKQVGGATDDATTPLPPTYQLRIGVVERVDIGVRVGHASSVGVDVKWNFVKTDAFDMAVAPGIQAWYYDSCSADGGSHGQVYGNLPLLFGINASDWVSIVPTAGISYGCTSRVTLFGTSASDAARISGPMIRAGLGVDFRISPKVGLHPELTYLKYIGADSKPAISWMVVGLGLNFGALPQPGGS
jgi:hypothetical protein